MKHYTNQFISYCKTNRNLSDLTVRAYGLDLKQFIQYLDAYTPHLGNYKEVTRIVLDDYVSILSERYKAKTIKRHMACLRSYFNYLEYTERIRVNPFDKFRLNIKEGFYLPVSLEFKEVEKILKAAYKERAALANEADYHGNVPALYFIYTRNIAILELLFASGLRVGELCSISNTQMCADFTTVSIVGKGNKERELFVGHPQVMKSLKEYASLRKRHNVETPAFFITKFGKALTTQAVRNIVTKYTEMAGIRKNVTPPCLPAQLCFSPLGCGCQHQIHSGIFGT